MTRLLPLLLVVACDSARLVPLPEAGPAAEEGTRWHDPLPPPPEVEEDCELVLVWPLEDPPAGECRPGWVDCEGRGEAPVLPTETDGDCDGIADDSCAPWAVALVIDASGSMEGGGYRGPIESALCALSPRQDATRALVSFGHNRGYNHAADAAWGDDLCGSLTRAGGSQEYAAMAAMAVPGLIGWPAGHARGVVVVTDEPPDHPGVTNGVSILADWCEAEGVLVRVVTQDGWRSFWQPVADRCGGDVVLLDPTPTQALSGQPLPYRAVE